MYRHNDLHLTTTCTVCTQAVPMQDTAYAVWIISNLHEAITIQQADVWHCLSRKLRNQTLENPTISMI